LRLVYDSPAIGIGVACVCQRCGRAQRRAEDALDYDATIRQHLGFVAVLLGIVPAVMQYFVNKFAFHFSPFSRAWPGGAAYRLV